MKETLWKFLIMIISDASIHDGLWTASFFFPVKQLSQLVDHFSFSPKQKIQNKEAKQKNLSWLKHAEFLPIKP